jgi:hypothetical protein
MRVLMLSLGKIFFLQFFLQFLFFSVKRLDGPFLHSNVQVTCPDVRGLVTCLGGNARLDGLVIRPDEDSTGYISRIPALAASTPHLFLNFSCLFGEFFSWVLA